jgi:hypothetical protein
VAGQVLVVFGFLIWLVACVGLSFYGYLAAYRRCWAAAVLSKALALAFATAGIAAMYNIPGSIQ